MNFFNQVSVDAKINIPTIETVKAEVVPDKATCSFVSGLNLALPVISKQLLRSWFRQEKEKVSRQGF